MNWANAATSSWISVRPPAQLPTASSVPAGTPLPDGCGGARSSQPSGCAMPLGCDSVENAVTEVPPMQCWVVMPISLTYASAENWVSVATPAFQPNLPTRVPFRICDGSLGLGSTIDTWLAMPRMLDCCAEARLSKNESGIAST